MRYFNETYFWKQNDKIKKETVEDKIKYLEARIFTKKEPKNNTGYGGLIDSILMSSWFGTDTLEGRVDTLRKDFNELDKKFDELEKYLQIEYFKQSTETQTYDWADKEQKEGFRPVKKSYDQLKNEKAAQEKAERPHCDCDD